MSSITQMAGAYSNPYAATAMQKNSTPVKESEDQLQKAVEEKAGKITGRTFGNVQLSEKAANYYDELKSKFGHLNFVLVANDSIDQASAMAGSLGTPGKTTVLIDVEKIERMAEDEDFRKQYEGIIEKGANQIESMASQMVDKKGIMSYGLIVGKDGETSFFAVVDKSLQAQRERIDAKREEKRMQAREDKKRDAKERLESQIEKRHDASEAWKQKLQEGDDGLTSYNRSRLEKAYGKNKSSEQTEYVSASSMDELMGLLGKFGYSFGEASEGTAAIGQSVDLKF